MTINQAIDKLDTLCPNAYTREEKIKWLSALDGMIYDRIYATHADTPAPFNGYSPDDGDRTLYAAEPYDEIYLFFLQTRVFYYDGETQRQNAAEKMFRETYDNYRNRYNALHLPKTERRKTV